MNLKGAFLKVNSQKEPPGIKIIPSVFAMINYSSKSEIPEFIVGFVLLNI